MIEMRENSLKIKVVQILEDGMEREWRTPPEIFSGDLRQISLLAPVEIGGTLTRVGVNVNFDGRISGVCELTCSRCLEKYEYRIKGEMTAVFIPCEKKAERGDEVELDLKDVNTQFYDGDEIDMYDPVRDHIALSVPMHPLCNEVCKGLCHVCGLDLNEKECGCDRSPSDPRLAALKQLKFD